MTTASAPRSIGRNGTNRRKYAKVYGPLVAAMIIAAGAGCGTDSDTASASPTISAAAQPSSPGATHSDGTPGTTQPTAAQTTPRAGGGSATPVNGTPEAPPGPADTGTTPTDCPVDLSAAEVTQAIATLAPYQSSTGDSWQWSTNPAAREGTYNHCSTLSVVIVPVQTATASSPERALLFHKGEYAGTATPNAHAFTSVDAAAGTDDTVVLSYKTPGSCNACNDGTFTSVSYHWNGSGVDTQGQPPQN